MREWFKYRRISYYHDHEKGILFLQFSSTRCRAVDRLLEEGSCFASAIEEHDCGDLQGMLFMFTVSRSFPSGLFVFLIDLVKD